MNLSLSFYTDEKMKRLLSILYKLVCFELFVALIYKIAKELLFNYDYITIIIILL
jgi:hypothetical protein